MLGRVVFSVLLISLAAEWALAQGKPAFGALEAFIGAYELHDGTLARIMLRGDSLIAESGLGPTTRLRSVSGDVFESEGAEPLRLEFVRGSSSELRVRVTHKERTDEGRRVGVSRKTLSNYVGRYPLSAALAMVVTLEGESLIAQATGASRHPLFPESSTRFFVQDYQAEDVAQLEFGSDVSGPFVIFRQGGFEQKVMRK